MGRQAFCVTGDVIELSGKVPAEVREVAVLPETRTAGSPPGQRDEGHAMMGHRHKLPVHRGAP